MIQVVASENCIHCHESNCCTNLSLNGDGSSILGLQLENMDEYVPPEDTYKSLTCSAQETPSNPPCKPQLNQRNPTNRPTFTLLPKGLPADTSVSVRPCRCNQNDPNGCEWHIFHPGRQILAVHHKKTSGELVQSQYSPPNSPSNNPLTEGQLNSFGFGYHADATFTLKQKFSKKKDSDPWAQVHDERIQCLGCNTDVEQGDWFKHRGTCRGIEMRVADVIADAWEKEAKEGALASRASGIFSLFV